MNVAEKMCDYIFMIFKGKKVLDGTLSSIQDKYGNIPPFTPTLMIIRLATPVTIPIWQPVVGLIGVIIFTIFSVWAGGRIFRTLILMQGTKPKLGNLVKMVFRG